MVACLTLPLLFVLLMTMHRFGIPLPGSSSLPGLKSTRSASRKRFSTHLADAFRSRSRLGHLDEYELEWYYLLTCVRDHPALVLSLLLAA